MKTPFLGIVLALGSLSSVIAFADNISPSEALHLALHRAEHLVEIGSLDESYLSDFKGGEVQGLSQPAAQAAVYEVILDQAPAADGHSSSITLALDGQGKEVRHDVAAAGPAVGAPHFAGIDPITLTEYAFHYLIAHGDPAKPGVTTELVPYFRSLVSVSIAVGNNASGSAAGIVSFVSSADSRVLEVVMNLDKSVESFQLVH